MRRLSSPSAELERAADLKAHIIFVISLPIKISADKIMPRWHVPSGVMAEEQGARCIQTSKQQIVHVCI